MLDFLDEIESDLSRFHRVDDVSSLGSPRFFRLARLLPCYGGAVAAALAARAPAPAVSHHPVAPGSGGGQPRVVDDVATVAAMTASSGFPGIEYSGG